MGSASREALARSVSALAGLGSKADLATAEDLFAAGRVVADSAQLRAVVSDPSADPKGKVTVRPFGPLPRVWRREVEDEAARLEAWLR